MTVRVDTLSTEVTAEPERVGEDARESTQWEERAKAAAQLRRILRDEARTRAEGWDD
ncbi:MAG: hypothetical protein AB1941_13975 [Gemmatimonadota bacterium]